MLTLHSRLFSSLAVVSILAACRSEPTSPPAPFNLLEFNARISKSMIHMGDTATLEFVLRNPTPGRVTFFIGCGDMTQTIQNGSKETVFRLGDRCLALASVALIELAPGEEYVQRVTILGATLVAGTFIGNPLDVGRYTAFADLLQSRRSTIIQFEVVQ
jgi:hypothetical protein